MTTPNPTAKPKQEPMPADIKEVTIAKVPVWPTIVGSALATITSILATIAVMRWMNRKDEEKALAAKRAEEEATMLTNPGMPPMWPGINGKVDRAAPDIDEDAILEKFRSWESKLDARERAIDQREQHLRLVVGGDDD